MVPPRVAFQRKRAPMRQFVAALTALLLVGAPALSIHTASARERPRIDYPALRDDDAAARANLPQLRYRLPDADLRLSGMPATDVAAASAERLALLSQNYRPRPAIWRIGDRDTTIYLFGTIHSLPPGFAWQTEGLERIVARSRLLIVESVGNGVDDGASLALLDDGPAPPPLSARVDAAHKPKLAAFIATLPADAATLIDRMPSWIASVAISLVQEVRSGEVPGPGADDWLEKRFAAARKPVVAIEDSRAVLAAVNAVPQGDQQRMLHAALDAPVRSRAEMRAAAHAWAKGEIGPDSALSIDLVAATGSTAMAAPLLTDRNAAWTAALVKRLKQPGTMLFAAGAGHFIGAGSVIEQLEARGMRVTRVQ